MKEQFLTYEQSLKLKQLSFDEMSQFGFYYKLLEYKINDFRNGNTLVFNEGNPIFLTTDIDTDNNSLFLCDAPTFQQTFDWFEDNYDLNVTIEKEYTENMWHFTIFRKGLTVYSTIKSNENITNTRYESRVKCIDKILEIIEKEK